MKVHGATYRKLPGRTVNFFGGRSQLWLAEDHLLEVTGLMFAERYRRFPLADIRAFVIEKTRAQAIALWIYGGLSCVLILGLSVGGLFWTGPKNDSQEIFAVLLYGLAGLFGIVALIALVGFFITLFRGATCRCSIQTTAGLRILAAPTRRRGAEQVLALLAPVVEAAQTALSGASHAR